MIIHEFAQDLRISLRGLLRAPVLAATIVATVGLGIGSTTAIFSAVHAGLLRPLPYPDAGRLVRIYTDAPPNVFRFSVADYLALDQQQTHFDRIAAFTDRAMAFSDGDVAERLRGREVTWTYFGLLGLKPRMGRDFTEHDGRPGSTPAVIVSHGFWQRRLGGAASVIGRPIRLDGREHALVGVLPAAVGPLEQAREFFVVAQWEPPRRKGPFLYTTLGRLREGADRSRAAGELRAINRRMFPLWRASYQDEKATWSMMDLQAAIIGDVWTMAGLALAAVGLVWLIACANASSLLVTRAASRRPELALRAALGASRARVVGCLLTESGMLAVGAAVVGAAIAWAGTTVMREFGAGYFPRTAEIALDGAVLWLLVALTACSGLLFGLIPALHGTAHHLDESLRSSGRTATATVAVRRMRRVLVGSQFAIATPLLIVAALLTASLSALGRVDLGFDSRNLLTGSVSLPAQTYPEESRVASFWDELERRIERLPGVAAVAFADGRPPDDVGNFNNFNLEDFPTPPGQSQPVAPWVAVTPEYFKLLGLRLLEGRLLDDHDVREENVETVVVDRAWAQRFFPKGSAVGKRFREGGCTACPWTAVVGIVSEVKYAGLNRPDEGTVYWPMPLASRTRYLVVRTRISPEGVLPAVRQAIRDLDPGLPFSSVATVDDLVERSLERPRSLTLLVGAFAGVALLLSIVGIYGVMAFHVQQRSKDIGVRLALGGSPRQVLTLVVAQGMRVVAIGIGVGLLAAAFGAPLVSSLLFGVSAGDAVTFAAVGILLMVIATLACAVPARRIVGLPLGAILRGE